MRTLRGFTLPTLGGLGSVLSFVCGVIALFESATSNEGIFAIYALLVAVFFLAAAITTQSVRHRRPLRYSSRVSRFLRVAEKAQVRDPETFTGEQAMSACKNLLNDIAAIYSEINKARCLASIEVMTHVGSPQAPYGRRAHDYQVHTLCRDDHCDDLEHGVRIRQTIEGSSSYEKIFHDPTCGAHYVSGNVERERQFRCPNRNVQIIKQSGLRRLLTRGASAPYRSTLVIKICEASRCAARVDHFPIGYLWLRSAATNAFDEDIDLEIMQSIGRSLAPLVTRITRASLPTRDFRRGSPDLPQAPPAARAAGA